MEGFQNGLNRSPYHGFSVEFTEYRQYTPGDDPRFLDWKLYARSDKHYIKLFEDETNLRCTLLLDLSRSMGYGSGSHTKADYARTLAATLGWFLASQRDAVGLLTFDENVNDYIPARFRTGHMRKLLVTLEKQLAGKSTDINRPLREAAERISKRGMIVLISDLLAPVDELQSNLGFLRARGHEVVVFQVLDRAEIDFNFEDAALFEDAETGHQIYVDPNTARENYQQRFNDHISAVREVCQKLGITWRQLATDEPLELALSEFLRSRIQAGSTKQRPGRAATGRSKS